MASIQDILTGKISNKLVIAGYITALIYQIYFFGIKSLGFSFLGSVFLIFVMFPFFLNKSFGAGDIKLMSIAAFLLSIQNYFQILIFIIVSIISAAVISVFIMCIQRKFIRKIHFSIPILFSTIACLGGLY